MRLHALGPRTIAEFIATISGCSDIMPVLERFAAIDPAEVRAVGADRWPVSIFLVGDVRSGSAGLEAILRASLASADGDDAA